MPLSLAILPRHVHYPKANVGILTWAETLGV